MFLYLFSKVKYHLGLLMVVAFYVFSTPCSCQALEVALLDSQQFYSESKAFNSMNKQIAEESSRLQLEIEKISTKLREKREVLENKKSALSNQEYESQDAVLRKEGAKMHEYIMRNRTALKVAGDEAWKKFVEKADGVVRDYVKDKDKSGSDKKIDMVIESNAVNYSNPETIPNYTSQLIQELNKACPYIKVDFESARATLEKQRVSNSVGTLPVNEQKKAANNSKKK